MKRRNLHRAATMASMRAQAQAKRDNDASGKASQAIVESLQRSTFTLKFSTGATLAFGSSLAAQQAVLGPPLDLDAMEAAARERLRVHIHTSTLLHSSQIALGTAQSLARMDACIQRRSQNAALILKHITDELYWAWCGLAIPRSKQ